MKELELIEYHSKYNRHFYELNIEWLEKYFYVEEYDRKVLQQPEAYIIDKGGYIFFAKFNSAIVGTVALINEKECFELSKMAIHPDFRGQKIGQFLIHHCIDFAKSQNWEKIILYSSRKLIPALNLYKKVGFQEVPLEPNVHYDRADIKMVLYL